jgi:hypothetical protein
MMMVSSPHYLIHRPVDHGLVKLPRCAIGRLVRRVEAGKPSRGTGLPDEVSERIERALKGN